MISGPTNEEPAVLEIQPRGKLASNSRSGEKGLHSLLGWVPAGPLRVILSQSLLGAILVLCPLPDCKVHEDRDWDQPHTHSVAHCAFVLPEPSKQPGSSCADSGQPSQAAIGQKRNQLELLGFEQEARGLHGDE